MPPPEAPPVGGGDTKVCPYCAEVIKAAAIRCRYCHSDLEAAEVVDEPVVEPTVDPVEPVEPVDESVRAAGDDGVEAHPVRTSTGSDVGGPSRTVVLASVAAAVVVTLVLSVLAFLAWHRERDLEAASDAGRTVRATLPEKLQDVLSYDFQTFDDDKAKALAQLTPSFRKKYEKTLDAIQERATQQRRTQDAQVVAVAVVRASTDRVTTLVFVNRTTSTAGSDKTQVLQDRLNADVVRRDGTWLIDDISFPTS